MPFSAAGELNGAIHAPGSPVIFVDEAGDYRIDFTVNHTGSIGSAVAIAVNGMVVASSSAVINQPAGTVSGSVDLTLSAGDVITLRDNSAVPLQLQLAPIVGAQLDIYKEN